MKKKILSTILVSGVALSVFSPAALAAVEPVDNGPAADGSGHKSGTEVEVKLDQGGVDPTVGPYYKRLAIVWKPEKFTFTGKTGATVLSNSNPNKDNQYIVINDDRRTTGTEDFANAKWKLTGSLSNLDNTNTAASQSELVGKMTFTTNALESYDIGPTETKSDGSIDYVPAPHVKGSAAVTDTAFSLQPSFVLPSDESEVEIMQKTGAAADAEKRGVQTNLGNSTLDITNQVQSAGTYQGWITWSLDAVN